MFSDVDTIFTYDSIRGRGRLPGESDGSRRSRDTTDTLRRI